MKKILLLILISIFTITRLFSSGIIDIKKKLYNAYIIGNNSLWYELMSELEESYKKTNNIFILHELAKSQYGYIGMLIDRGEFEQAKPVLPKAEKNINKLLEYNENWTDVHGLKAGIYGFKIILYPNQVILNGPKGKSYLNKASSQKELTPSVIVEMANYKYHTPSILGGNIDDAIEYYQYAIKLFELTGQDKKNWQYINTLVWLAISYDKNRETTQAKRTLDKLLTLEPNFDWVKNNLYPKILQNESISKTYYSMSE